MRKKLLAGIGAAALFALMIPTSANAASEMLSESLTDPIGVDASQIEREFTATDAGPVTGVTVTVDFSTHDGENCAVPATDGSTYPDELGIVLMSPTGTAVSLVTPWHYIQAEDDYFDGTYFNSGAQSARVQVTFDDGAADVAGASSDGVPVTGTFQPAAPLSVLVGEEAAGVWQLVFADVGGSDVKCYYGATLNIETDAVAVVPSVTAPTPPAKIETAA